MVELLLFLLIMCDGDRAPIPPPSLSTPEGRREILSGCGCILGLLLLAAFVAGVLFAAAVGVVHLIGK